MKTKQLKLTYSEEFKRTVVEEIESGVMTPTQAKRYYGLGSDETVYKWLSIYGMNATKGKKVVIMSAKEETELISARRELALTKKQLEEAELRAIAWQSMVEAIEKDLGIEVKKKPWSQALLDARKKLYPDEYDSVLPDSAASTESANKPVTNAKRRSTRK